jgi:hypothetical protein
VIELKLDGKRIVIESIEPGSKAAERAPETMTEEDAIRFMLGENGEASTDDGEEG